MTIEEKDIESTNDNYSNDKNTRKKLNNSNEVSPKLEHSKFGKASLIIGILIPCLWILSYLSSAFIIPNTARGDAWAVVIITTITWFVSPLMWLAGIILSIIGLIKKGYRKTLPAISLILHIVLTCLYLPVLYISTGAWD